MKRILILIAPLLLLLLFGCKEKEQETPIVDHSNLYYYDISISVLNNADNDNIYFCVFDTDRKIKMNDLFYYAGPAVEFLKKYAPDTTGPEYETGNFKVFITDSQNNVLASGYMNELYNSLGVSITKDKTILGGIVQN